MERSFTLSQLGDVYKMTEGALNSFVQIIDKIIKQNWPHCWAVGNLPYDWAGSDIIHHHSLNQDIQSVFYAAKSAPVQAISIHKLLQENAVRNCQRLY